MHHASRREFGWPAAATLIAALVGVLSAAVALGPGDETRFASAREMGEVRAGLAALENSTQQLRAELRSDLRELRELMGRLVRQREGR